MKYLALVLLLTLLVVSCKTQQPVIYSDYSGPKLTFGSGGGFTGKYVSHAMISTGEVFLSKDQSKSFVPTRGIDKKVAVQMIENFKNLGFDKINHNDPGNMTYFIALEEDGKKHNLSWGGAQKEVPAELKAYFRTLSMLVKKSTAATK